jgi:hypothetical protein
MVRVTHVESRSVKGLVPGGVEVSHARREVGRAPVERSHVGGVLRDTIVDSIDGLNELLCAELGGSKHA